MRSEKRHTERPRSCGAGLASAQSECPVLAAVRSVQLPPCSACWRSATITVRLEVNGLTRLVELHQRARVRNLPAEQQ
jgi:hypothetical protein